MAMSQQLPLPLNPVYLKQFIVRQDKQLVKGVEVILRKKRSKKVDIVSKLIAKKKGTKIKNKKCVKTETNRNKI